MRGRLFKIALFCCAIMLCSCSNEDKEKNTENRVENEEVQNTLDSAVSAIEYKNQYYKNRVSILKCITNYKSDVEAIRALESNVLSFDSCEFAPIDKLETVMELKVEKQDITPADSLAAIKRWLKRSKINDIDTDKEIRDSGGEYESDVSKKYPYSFPAVSKYYPDFETGNSFFINTKRCYILMNAGGVYSMSDGIIAKYLGSKSRAEADVFYGEDAETVAEGKVSELADKSWELLSGKMTVKTAADLTKRYFEQGIFLPCAKDVTVDVPEVKVFRLKDKYGYMFRLRRVYQEIPFAYISSYGEIYSIKNSVDGDDRMAYVVNGQTVNACLGSDSESEEVIPEGEAQDYIVSIQEAVSILEKNLIPQEIIEIDETVDIEEVGFVYCPCWYSDRKKNVYPCWEFRGKLGSNQDELNLYVNALNGEIYSYGCR
ncbi:MAG: hypothetical protein J1E62_01780 [Lachnospiraceae bacterium]|nr:hypothetical protein [Lachnospiraceae bacterium]